MGDIVDVEKGASAFIHPAYRGRIMAIGSDWSGEAKFEEARDGYGSVRLHMGKELILVSKAT
jgi:hypothetical protein